jgi:hypothetical protein
MKPVCPPALLLVCVAALAWPGLGLAQHAHVHGHAQLGVAVDGGTLLVDLSAPLESLVGFEHAPRTSREHEAMAAMNARLKQGASLWRPNPEAECAVRSQDADVHREDGHGHADVTAHVTFDCAQPQALRHLDIEVWQAFKNMKSLSVSVALPRKQFTLRLKRAGGKAMSSRIPLVVPKAR